MNLKNYLISILKTNLYHKKGKTFERYFKILNSLVLNWPISVSYIDKFNCYKIKDPNDHEIYFSIPSRTERFKSGVKARLTYLKDEYMLDECEIEDNDIIIDVGANIGEISLFINFNWNCKIIAIEPEELEFNCLIHNTKGTNTISKNVALWSDRKNMTLYQKNETSDSSLFEIENFTSKKIINTETLDFIIEDEGFHVYPKFKLLKLEAEGGEPEILLGSSKYIDRFEYISVDVGPERGLKKESTFIQVNDILSNHHFKPVNYYHKRGIVLFKNIRH